ncbi:MAG: hypothetical protein CL844_02145 [Crocinitomicaceae bacterium]|nr:hypothetical protein [Crocinitomicaceae bacterium]
MNSSKKNKPKLLMLVSRFPFPLDKGDKLRAFYQIKEMSDFFDITLIALSEREVSKNNFNQVKIFCDKIIICKLTLFSKIFHISRSIINGNPFQIGFFYSYRAQKKINSIIKENNFKYIYCQLVRTSEYVKNHHEIPKALDYMDALSIGAKRRIKKEPFYKKWIFKLENERLIRYEKLIFDFFEIKTIISEQDQKLIHHPENNKIICIPNGIDDFFFKPIQIKKDHDFVFIGNMSYAPNIQAVKYIYKNILPKFPKSKLLISGASPHKSIIRLTKKSNQITLIGWVDDIRKSYYRGKLFLAPMIIGSGMQNKILEAMAIGIPCVTTPLVNNAIKAKQNKEIFEVNSINEFNKVISKLLKDPKLQKTIGENGKMYVKKNYTWTESTSILINLMKEDYTN